MSLMDGLMSAVGFSKEHVDALGAAWPGLYAKITDAMQQGKDPHEPEVKSTATHLVELIRKATGKSLSSEGELQELVTQYGPVLAQYVGDKVPDEGFIGYVAKAAGLS